MVIACFWRDMGFVASTRFCRESGFVANTRFFGLVLSRLLLRHKGFYSDFVQISAQKIGGWDLCSTCHRLFQHGAVSLLHSLPCSLMLWTCTKSKKDGQNHKNTGVRLGWFLFWWKLEIQLLHGFKLFHFVHWCRNRFCFRSQMIFYAVCNFFAFRPF